MHSVNRSRIRSSRAMRASISSLQQCEARSQNSRVGATPSGSSASTSPITESGMPRWWEARMKATRRSVSRRYRRWFPAVRRLRISPCRS